MATQTVCRATGSGSKAPIHIRVATENAVNNITVVGCYAYTPFQVNIKSIGSRIPGYSKNMIGTIFKVANTNRACKKIVAASVIYITILQNGNIVSTGIPAILVRIISTPAKV